MEGPAFSTRAESLMHRLWGGDLIGMTAMPEAKLAREAEISYALVALVTDYDCWRRPPVPAAASGSPAPGARAGGTENVVAPVASPDPHLLLKEIIANLQSASENGVRLIRRAVQRMAERQDELMAAPALRSLELAIWSDKSRIAGEEIERLGPLWGKYFEAGA
jgi:5'-methylthioadenosine phosphorylase